MFKIYAAVVPPGLGRLCSKDCSTWIPSHLCWNGTAINSSLFLSIREQQGSGTSAMQVQFEAPPLALLHSLQRLYSRRPPQTLHVGVGKRCLIKKKSYSSWTKSSARQMMRIYDVPGLCFEKVDVELWARRVVILSKLSFVCVDILQLILERDNCENVSRMGEDEDYTGRGWLGRWMQGV